MAEEHKRRRATAKLAPRRKRKRSGAPPGQAPGTLEAQPDAAPTRITAIGYGPDGAQETLIQDLDEIDQLREMWPIVWVDVVGLGDATRIAELGKRLGLHRLSLEDVLHGNNRPKLEDYEQHLFLVAHALHLNEHLENEQLSFFLGRDYAVTFQERAEDPFEEVRNRLREGRGRVRQSGPDYLVYALLDAVVDRYFPLLDHYETQLDLLEEAIFERDDEELMSAVHSVRRDLRHVRRLTWPLQTVLERLMLMRGGWVKKSSLFYIRDCHDHTVRIVEQIDTLRDLASGLMDYHLSMINNRMNAIMKVLTVVAAIFIPLTFVAGVYGMNFDTSYPLNMPLTRWRYGYPAIMGAMTLMAVGLLWVFKRKKWLE